MSKDLSKYPGFFKMCGGCSKKEKREGLQKEDFFCLYRKMIVSASCDLAMTCEEFDGAYVQNLPQE